MKIYSKWQGFKGKHKKVVLGMGNFDGVHIGHQKLIYELVALAKDVDGTPAVFTFSPHPMAVLNPGNCPPQLLSEASKQEHIERLGVEVLLMVPFNLEFAGLKPEEFIEDVLFNELGVYGVVVGYNYTFGCRGSGTPELLEKLSSRYGYMVKVIPPVVIDGQAVSSTLIRNLLLRGDVGLAAKYLGYYPFAEGEVIVGDGRGSLLGFPTANLEINQNLLVPANGVYMAKVAYEGETYLGMANIGTKPTFQGKKRNIEVHLLDFCEELYGKRIKVSFRRKIREEKRFSSPSDLIEQIKLDIIKARSEWSKVRE
ncbi:MAG TPA: bifunctional riboflavin kinase/FAD synthetase [Bacillota bacterium]|nr:bifunctional riboflavin kinase/FAD synthetase [Bacillota bacterium]